MKSTGLFVFLAGIVIAIVSTIPYLYVMVFAHDPNMGKPTEQIVVFLAGGVLGFICLVAGMMMDRSAAEARQPQRVR